MLAWITFNKRYAFESCPESLGIATVWPAMKKTLVINGANLHRLNNPIIESNSEPLPDVCVKNVYEFFRRHSGHVAMFCFTALV